MADYMGTTIYSKPDCLKTILSAFGARVPSTVHWCSPSVIHRETQIALKFSKTFKNGLVTSKFADMFFNMILKRQRQTICKNDILAVIR